jgi:hypothetical protein
MRLFSRPNGPSWLALLCLAGLPALIGAEDAALAKKRKPPQPGEPAQPQDPMEVENGTLATQPVVVQPAGSGSNTGGGSGGGSGSGQSGSGGQGSGQNGGQSSAGSRPAPHDGEKAGRFMANLKIGPAVCLYDIFNGPGTCSHQGAVAVELGFSVLPNKNAYLVLPLQFQFFPGRSAIMVPLGFQYDLALPVATGLYLYPRFSVGYAAVLDVNAPGSPTTHAGVIIPELGIKYIYRGRWNFALEPISLPILFGSTSSGAFGSIYYRILLSAGVNF